MNWHININNSLTPLGALSLSEAKLKTMSLAPDEFTMTSALADVAHGDDYMELFLGQSRRFCGRLFKKRHIHTPDGEKYEYTFRNAWQNFEQTPYTQVWAEYDISTSLPVAATKGKVVMGYDYNGNRIGLRGQISDIFNEARTEQLECSVRSDFEDVKVLDDEMSGLNCEEALKRCMRWMPDMASHFDYSGDGPPVLVLTRRRQVEKKLLGEPVKFKRISHCERDDLRVENVSIIYEKTHSVDGKSRTVSTADSYPGGSDVDMKKSVVYNVSLQGTSATTQNAYVKTEPIRASSPEWWKDKLPFLQNSQITEIEVSGVKRKSTLPRELVTGTVYDWMEQNVERDVIMAEIAYYVEGVKMGVKNCAYKCVATDASTRLYSHSTISGSDETAPEGLAKAIYDAASQSLTEGDALIADAENMELTGRRIEVPGKFEEAVVTGSLLDIFTKTLSISFGPPTHLYPASIGRIFQMTRQRKAATVSNRSSGMSASSGIIDTGGTGTIETSSMDFKSMATLEISDPDERLSKVVISMDDIDPQDDARELEIRLRKTLVVHNGRPHYAYLLMSQPFEAE